MTVRIIVDSTSDVGLERAKQYGMTIVPLTISFGEEEFRDGIDMDNATFYARLQSSTVLPKTSTPSITAFENAFNDAIKDGVSGILVISITSKLSGTMNAAHQAKMLVSEKSNIPINIVDSRMVSAGIGLTAILVAKRAQSGASLDELTTYANDLFDHTRIFFVLNTLEYLEKGGRIGRAQAVFGSILNMKPILHITEGEVASLERVRTRSKALVRLGELVKEIGPLAYVGVAASDDESAREGEELVRPYTTEPIEVFKVGPVIGTYAGPKAVGIVTIQK